MSKVEDVARAIREADIMSLARREALPIEKIRQYADECQPDYDAMARAAIEAMREPTLEMMEDGDRNYRATATSGISGMTIEAQIRSKCVRFGEGWRAAIDAALREEGR